MATVRPELDTFAGEIELWLRNPLHEGQHFYMIHRINTLGVWFNAGEAVEADGALAIKEEFLLPWPQINAIYIRHAE